MNVIGTLVSCVLPALFPPCYVFREVGPVVADGENRDNLLCVSADGIIECINASQECHYATEDNDHKMKIPVEIKCPFNLDNLFYDPLYILPERYVPQVTSQMFVFQSDVALFVTKSDNSLVVKRILNDEHTWHLQQQIITTFYDSTTFKKPNKFHPNRVNVKEQVKCFAEMNTSVSMEIPLAKCVETNQAVRDGTSPFKKHKDYVHIHVDKERLMHNIQNVLSECLCVIRDAHTISRHKASEMLIFMLSDSDRMKLQTDDTYTHAIGYAMKGHSLNVKTLRQMLELLRNTCKQYTIPILCECFDGQWANLAFKDENGKPLTLLHLLNDSWEKSRNLSRRNIILKFNKISTVKTEDLVNVCTDLTSGQQNSLHGNIKVSVKRHHKEKCFYIVESGWGTSESDHPLLNKLNLSKVKKNIKDDTRNECVQNKGKITGLLPDDIDFVSTMDPDLLHDIYHDRNGNNDDLTLEDFICSPRLQLITEILNELKSFGKAPEWNQYNEDDLFPHILIDKETLLMFTRHDLDIIISVIEKYTRRKIFTTKDTKDNRAAKIAFLFGSGKLMCKADHKVPSLKSIAVNCVEAFPLRVLQSVHASIMHINQKRLWHDEATITMSAYVPIVNDYVPLFYYPEFSRSRNQVEFRTMDYTHQLTNIRSIICRKGIDNVKSSEFHRICNEHPHVLSKGIVVGELDKQCASMAIQLFSQEVEDKLTENQAYSEALFVKLIRNWYKACDERGIAADERVNNLWALYAYLTKDVDFDMFPGYTQYVKGIPIITYAGMLQNISVRMALYQQAKCCTYNHRSISSLVCESFFSTVSSRDPGKTGCPKSVDVPKIMSDMIILEQYKQDCLRY